MTEGAPGFVVSGTHSGVGKTTASFATMSALAERGYAVQPFKIGPDFIDPSYHQLACHRPSVNLDLWMMGPEGIRDAVERYGRDADVVILEGMGALHDGENGTSDSGSAAWFARFLGLPVLLVVDVWGMTRSTAAVVRGFQDYDSRVNIAGIFLNRAGSRRHYDMVLEGLPDDIRRRVVGYLPADDALAVSERHLGLVTVEENPKASSMRREILRRSETTIDIDRLVDRFEVRRSRGGQTPTLRPSTRLGVRIGVARDRAFCFYYLENLRVLQEAGAELIPFSPVEDRDLPEALAGLYLGGGYPESFAETLANKTELRQQIRTLAERGAPIYAECGGLMYLSERLTGFEGGEFPMLSVLPLEVEMDRRHLVIRYVEIETMRASILGPAGTRARGQEFHQSRIVRQGMDGDLYRWTDSSGETGRAGFASGSVVGSYVHLYFGAGLARSLVDAARKFAS